MPKEEKLEEIKHLINVGKEKGYLTYDDLNNILPPDIVSSEQIDNIMMMFGEMDIEVVDSSNVERYARLLENEEDEEMKPTIETVETSEKPARRTIEGTRRWFMETSAARPHAAAAAATAESSREVDPAGASERAATGWPCADHAPRRSHRDASRRQVSGLPDRPPASPSRALP